MLTVLKNDIPLFAVKAIGKPAVFFDNKMEYDDDDQEVWNSVVVSVSGFFEEKKKGFETLVAIIHGGLVLFDTREEQIDFFKLFSSEEIAKAGLYISLISEHGEFESDNA